MTDDRNGRLRELVASLPLAVLPLITRRQAERVLLDVASRAGRYMRRGLLPADFPSRFRTLAETLDYAVSRKWARDPLFWPASYRGALSLDLGTDLGTVAVLRHPNTIVLSERADPHFLAHELTHYLTYPRGSVPPRTFLLAKPFYQFYRDPERAAQVADTIAEHVLRRHPVLASHPDVLREFVSYRATPEELLAGLVAARIAESPEFDARLAQRLLHPQFEGLIDYLADLIAPMR